MTAKDEKVLALQESLKAQLVDYLIDVPEQFTKTSNYVMCKEGVMHVRHTPLADFITKPLSLPKFKSLEAGVKLHVPKIPYHFICQIMSFFQAVNKRDRTEASALIFFDPDTQEHFIHIPEQDNSGAGSHFDQDVLHHEYRRTKIPVMELHSHSSMGAFWSGTDDANETFPQFYMVFGKLDKVPEYLVRYSTGAAQLATSLFTIVERPQMTLKVDVGNGESIEYPYTEEAFLAMGMPFPEEWMDKIKKPFIAQCGPKNTGMGYQNFGKRGNHGDRYPRGIFDRDEPADGCHIPPPDFPADDDGFSIMGAGRDILAAMNSSDSSDEDKKKIQEVSKTSQEETQPQEPTLIQKMDTIRRTIPDLAIRVLRH